MDLVDRARGSLSRSTLLLRESILEADGEEAGEGGRWESRGGYSEEERKRGRRGWRVGESQSGERGDGGLKEKQRVSVS